MTHNIFSYIFDDLGHSSHFYNLIPWFVMNTELLDIVLAIQ